MNDAFDDLRRAFNIDTSPDRFSFFLCQGAVAYGTFFWKLYFCFTTGPQLCQRLYDVWYYIACPFYEDRIPDHEIFFLYDVFIKKRNGRNRNPSNRNWFYFSNRGN